MSSRHVKRKPIPFKQESLDSIQYINAISEPQVHLFKPISQVLTNHEPKYISDSKQDLNRKESNTSSSVIEAAEYKSGPMQSTVNTLSRMRKSTFHSNNEDENSSSTFILKPNILQKSNSIFRMKSSNKEIRKRQLTIERKQEEHLGHQIQLMNIINIKKEETDRVYQLQKQLKEKDNEIIRLKAALQEATNPTTSISEKCTKLDYKLAILISNEFIKYSNKEVKELKEFELLNKLYKLCKNEDDEIDKIKEMVNVEYKTALNDLYSMLKLTIQKNLVLNDQLLELGLSLPNTLIQESDFERFNELYNKLTLKKTSTVACPTTVPTTKELESRQKLQIENIHIKKWEREAIAKDIESGYHVCQLLI